MKRQIKYRRSKKGVLARIYNDQRANSKKYGRPLPDYTMLEFRNAYIDDPAFLKHYDRWVENDYLQSFRPCFDRVDCFKPYTFDNLQIISCRDNQKKASQDKKARELLRTQRQNKYYDEMYCVDCKADRIKKLEVYNLFISETCTICKKVDVKRK